MRSPTGASTRRLRHEHQESALRAKELEHPILGCPVQRAADHNAFHWQRTGAALAMITAQRQPGREHIADDVKVAGRLERRDRDPLLLASAARIAKPRQQFADARREPVPAKRQDAFPVPLAEMADRLGVILLVRLVHLLKKARLRFVRIDRRMQHEGATRSRPGGGQIEFGHAQANRIPARRIFIARQCSGVFKEARDIAVKAGTGWIEVVDDVLSKLVPEAVGRVVQALSQKSFQQWQRIGDNRRFTGEARLHRPDRAARHDRLQFRRIDQAIQLGGHAANGAAPGRRSALFNIIQRVAHRRHDVRVQHPAPQAVMAGDGGMRPFPSVSLLMLLSLPVVAQRTATMLPTIRTETTAGVALSSGAGCDAPCRRSRICSRQASHPLLRSPLMTAQFPDVLNRNDQTYALFSNPLEMYFKQACRHPAIEALHRHTACTRGYVAFWQIADGRLYLTQIDALDRRQVPLSTIFPEATERVLASWFTGELRCPQGARYKYVHFDYCSVYERDLFIGIENGVVRTERTVENPPPPPRDPLEESDIPEFLKKRG
jgi:hypothetical protein